MLTEIVVALPVSALIFAPNDRRDVKLGEGKGKSVELTEVNEFIDFLMFVTGEDNHMYLRSVPDVSEGFSNMSVKLLDSQDTDSRTQRVITKFISGTVHEETVVSQRLYQSKKSYDSGINAGREERQYEMSLTRSLSIYISDTAVYYHSSGNMYTNDNGSAIQFIFDMELYNDADRTYIKFNRFDFTGDYREIGGKLLDSGIGIWFDVTFEDDLSMNELLARTYIGEIASELIGADESDFERTGDVYFAELSDESSIDGEYEYLEIDISNGKNPSAEYGMKLDEESDGYSNYASQLVRFSFENIDNTVVEFDEDIKVEKNIDKYFKVYEEDNK